MEIGRKKVTIHVCNKDRHSELALLLQSLRTQTYKEWDLCILDESQTPIEHCHFLMMLINRIKLEKHYVNIIRNENSMGVCYARNKIIENDYFNNNYTCRVDDDVILDSKYLDKLFSVIHVGYDIASGITPVCGQPLFKRQNKKVKPIINKKEINSRGEITKHGDDCGYGYIEEEIISAHEFRSCALIKKEIIDKIKYPTNLSPVGFREEAFFSFKAQSLGYKIGVHTGAIAWHLVAPSGGVRYPDYQDKVKSDDNYFKKWVKEMYNNGELK